MLNLIITMMYSYLILMILLLLVVLLGPIFIDMDHLYTMMEQNANKVAEVPNAKSTST